MALPGNYFSDFVPAVSERIAINCEVITTSLQQIPSVCHNRRPSSENMSPSGTILSCMSAFHRQEKEKARRFSLPFAFCPSHLKNYIMNKTKKCMQALEPEHQ